MYHPDVRDRPSSPWYRNYRFWLGVLVSLALVAWAVRALDWAQVRQAYRQARPAWLLLALVTVLLTIAARVVRWRVLLLPRRVPWRVLLSALLAGQVANYAIASQVGLLVRAGALGPGRRAAGLGSVVVEKLLDIAVLLGLAVFLSLTLPLPDWLLLSLRMLALVGGGAVLGILLFPALTARFPALARWTPTVSRAGLLGGMLVSLLVWGLGAATNYCVLRGFGLPAGPAPTLLLLAALQAGGTVPALPGSIGVFEGICIGVLALFGVEQEPALAAGLALHGVVFIPPLVLGGLSLWRLTYST